MHLRELIFLICSDLERYREVTVQSFFREFAVGVGFKYLVWLRINHYLQVKSCLWMPLRLTARLLLRKSSLRFGIDISRFAEVGPGLKIEHFGGIFVNGCAHIGMHCTLCQDVTLGGYRGAPQVGDFVFIGPGAKLLNGIQVGRNTIIGSNSVVTRDTPDDAVVVGIPGKVISLEGNLRGERLGVMRESLLLYKKWCPRSLWHKYGLDTRVSDDPDGALISSQRAGTSAADSSGACT